MFLLLPQALASDQRGAGEAVAAHFAAEHDWGDAVHSARAKVRRRRLRGGMLPHSACSGCLVHHRRCIIQAYAPVICSPPRLLLKTAEPAPLASPRQRQASDVFRRSQLVWGGGGGASKASLLSSRSRAGLERLSKPAVEVRRHRMLLVGKPCGFLERCCC